MKCPKCGYLGFETTDRCRNCQYDFSLAPATTEPELTLHNTRKTDLPTDFDLPPIRRQSDGLSATALDLDRLFGEPDVRLSVAAPEPPSAPAITVIEDDARPSALEEIPQAASSMAFAEPEMPAEPVIVDAPPMAVIETSVIDVEQPAVSLANEAALTDEAALPFEDAPIVPPPAARAPLAVRRSTPEVPRNRPRTTRPIRPDSLNLESASPASLVAREANETMQSLLESPTLGVRVGAGMIDVLLLVGIDAAVLYLTLKVTGLQSTLEDLRVLPAVPFVGFLALLAFGYVASFTVAGGQTIGKMVLSLRVIGDDGRPIDAAGGMLRALGCMLVPVTFGLSFLPALFTSDHRAIHDRLAGTRVVQE
jgi:uncharacterized RDD family membrane protein YckC